MSRIQRNAASVVVVIVLFAGHLTASGQDANEVIQRLQTKYDGIETLSASFTQTMKSEYLDSAESASGSLALNGNQFRIETPEQTFVTDGAFTWLFNSANQEVLINDYVEEDMFPVRELLFDYDDKYEVVDVRSDKYRGETVDVLEMSARDDMSLYRKLTLYIRRSDTVVTRLEILDANETEMIFELDDIELNPKFGEDVFTFVPPADTNVVDLRS